ncbi:MAG: hypothetical protein FWB85_02720 [Chitinispirillia bacterium]|nr:hypothetical protein [Chitinispirillia bacterium]MCL2241337.1 hypothetical protein [Chitinispirillia bacterium]
MNVVRAMCKGTRIGESPKNKTPYLDMEFLTDKGDFLRPNETMYYKLWLTEKNSDRVANTLCGVFGWFGGDPYALDNSAELGGVEVDLKYEEKEGNAGKVWIDVTEVARPGAIVDPVSGMSREAKAAKAAEFSGFYAKSCQKFKDKQDEAARAAVAAGTPPPAPRPASGVLNVVTVPEFAKQPPRPIGASAPSPPPPDDLSRYDDYRETGETSTPLPF